MSALEVVVGNTTNPTAVFGTVAMVAGAGNTFTIRDFPETSSAVLEGIWTEQVTAGQVRIRSPRFHDDVQGIRKIAAAGQVRNLMGDREEQRLYPNDPLRFEMTGGAAEVDAAAFLVRYADLGGINARLESWESVKPRIIDICGQQVTVVGPAVTGDWSAGTAINATNDNLKADTDYAILGYETAAAVLAVAVAGTDTGNLRVGGPGPVEPIETRQWFVDMSLSHGTPHIPIFNSNNRANTLVHIARITAGGTVAVTLQLARLAR